MCVHGILWPRVFNEQFEQSVIEWHVLLFCDIQYNPLYLGMAQNCIVVIWNFALIFVHLYSWTLSLTFCYSLIRADSLIAYSSTSHCTDVLQRGASSVFGWGTFIHYFLSKFSCHCNSFKFWCDLWEMKMMHKILLISVARHFTICLKLC